jgi:hypothetical protein
LGQEDGGHTLLQSHVTTSEPNTTNFYEELVVQILVVSMGKEICREKNNRQSKK